MRLGAIIDVVMAGAAGVIPMASRRRQAVFRRPFVTLLTGTS